MIAQDHAAAPLHQKKRRADDLGILTDQVNFGRGAEMRMHGLKHARFANHVVRFGRDRAERRAPQHHLASSDSQKISEIRMAAGKLFDFDSIPSLLNFAP